MLKIVTLNGDEYYIESGYTYRRFAGDKSFTKIIADNSLMRDIRKAGSLQKKHDVVLKDNRSKRYNDLVNEICNRAGGAKNLLKPLGYRFTDSIYRWRREGIPRRAFKLLKEMGFKEERIINFNGGING